LFHYYNIMGNGIWHNSNRAYFAEVVEQKHINRYTRLEVLFCFNGISPNIMLPQTIRELTIMKVNTDIPIEPPLLPSGLERLTIRAPCIKKCKLPDKLSHLEIWCDDLDALPYIPDSLTSLICYTELSYLIEDKTIATPLKYHISEPSHGSGKTKDARGTIPLELRTSTKGVFVVHYPPHAILLIRNHQQQSSFHN